ncbi:hypothetical protein NE235_26710 [Actinoallomurus spadix]|uniref:Uncharacterized protein n=1 Tax=Actinoallomurus spadix TaxID=79912 RepID=A0ABP3GP71_9ACTN|nr:hypothetical protein [Actinoallomurus spadix]MCO5989706.1 hypothetical protein [Actinoallomurus spadix]
MRLKRATLTFAGAAGALAVTTLAASPAWACNDRDPALRLEAKCGANGQPNWMVSNPNRWGAVPMTWRDDKGGHSDRKVPVPAGGAVALPTHASKVMVVAYRPDRRDLPVWQRHGAFGVKHCTAAPTPPKKPHKPTPSKPAAHKPTAKPTKPSTKPQSATPVPTTAPTGEARPAQPVKAQPKFTG